MTAEELAKQLMKNPDGIVLIINSVTGEIYLPKWASKDVSDGPDDNTTVLSVEPLNVIERG